MFSRKKPELPIGSPAAGDSEQRLANLENHVRKLMEAVGGHFESLNLPGAIQVSEGTVDASPIGATSASTGKFTTLEVTTSSIFPKASWTPVLTFATPGDLAVGVYSEQLGEAFKIGVYRIARFGVGATMTHTTASGNLQISGLAEAAVGTANYTVVGALSWQGITKAGYTHVVANVNAGASVVNFVASGSGVNISAVSTSDVPSGGTVLLRGAVIYQVS